MSYPAKWHSIYGDKTGESARRILPPLLDLFGIRSLVEIGCGNGHWTQAAIDHGVEDYLAVDGHWNKRDELLVDQTRFREADLTLPLALDRRFDLAICLEVAEHVAASSAETLVSSLVGSADILVFGAAIPYQGGSGHINEQWPSYWRELLAERDYEAFDLVRQRHWTDRSIHYWYRQNTLVYVSRRHRKAMEQATQASGGIPMTIVDLVHPEKFEETASYSAISLKRLVRRLPGWVLGRIKSKLRGIG